MYIYIYIYIDMADDVKETIIKKVYDSDDHGFGSTNSTWRVANKQNPGITLQSVQIRMNKENVNKLSSNIVDTTLMLQATHCSK